MTGQRWEGRATLLEPVREHGAHASARVRLSGLARSPSPGCACPERVGRGRRRRGRPRLAAPRLGPRGRRSGGGRSRGAGRAARQVRRLPGVAAARMRRWRSTGCARPARGGAGSPGRSTAVRRRAEVGLARGLPRARRRCCAAWCSARTSGCRTTVRTDFQRSGLAHLLAVSGQNVVLLAMLALGAGMVAGLPLRARLALALALVALYVPLAGGGPSIQRAGVMGGAGLVAALAGRPASRWYALGLAVVRRRSRSTRARRARSGGSSRSPPSSGCSRSRRAGARPCGAPACPGRSRSGGGHRGRDGRDRAADGAPLRAGLARLAAGQPRSPRPRSRR